MTDSETYKSRTLYFRKAFWARATGAAIARLTHVLKLKPLTSAQLGAVMDKPDRVLATANVRFVPKRNGIRPVVNLSARPLQNKQSEGAKAPRSAPTATQTQATSTSAPPLKRSRTMESQAPPIDAKSVTKPPAMNSHPKTGPVLSVNGALSGVHDVSDKAHVSFTVKCPHHGSNFPRRSFDLSTMKTVTCWVQPSWVLMTFT